ncbi:MAG: OmpA family protein [Pyrinomonadaceae bacterium]|nr:OmpA family protein [Sphingobacteriaceae bacterium]
MKIKAIPLLLFLSFFTSLKSFSISSDTLKLYYQTDEKQLADKAKRLDSLLSIPDRKIVKISIEGYADYCGSTAYNSNLSRIRANIVKEYLKNKLSDVPFTVDGRGEIPAIGNEAVWGNALSRRVDVVVEYLQIIQPPIISVKKDSLPLLKLDTISDALKGISTTEKLKKLSNLKSGDRINLDELLFISHRHFLQTKSLPYVDILLKTLRKNVQLKIEIVGHVAGVPTNEDGYDEDTRDNHLSLNRAKLIYDYLVKNGIASERLSYRGVGNSQPKVYPERTSEDQEKNRRVEIIVVENQPVKL